LQYQVDEKELTVEREDLQNNLPTSSLIHSARYCTQYNSIMVFRHGESVNSKGVKEESSRCATY
jgi:hypothetical protein